MIEGSRLMTTLDGNLKDAATTVIDVSAKTRAALYVKYPDDSGKHSKHLIALLVSPTVDGDDWVEEIVLTGKGHGKVEICAMRAKACIKRAEGAASQVEVEMVFQ